VLSEFAGAAKELDRALLINPHEIDGVAAALKLALEMTVEERRARHAPMLEYLIKNDIKNWADVYLSTLSENSQSPGLLNGIRALFAGAPDQRPPRRVSTDSLFSPSPAPNQSGLRGPTAAESVLRQTSRWASSWLLGAVAAPLPSVPDLQTAQDAVHAGARVK
jgi:hypothetical protein